MQVGVVLVAALYFLVAKLNGHLIACQSVETAVAYKSFGSAFAGDYYAALKLHHLLASLPVMMLRISASV